MIIDVFSFFVCGSFFNATFKTYKQPLRLHVLMWVASLNLHFKDTNTQVAFDTTCVEKSLRLLGPFSLCLGSRWRFELATHVESSNAIKGNMLLESWSLQKERVYNMNMLLHKQSKPHKCFITIQTILGRAKNGGALYYFAIQDVGKCAINLI